MKGVPDTEGIITAVLHGAAKILGCDSASLIVFNEEAQEVSLRVGTVSGSSVGLAEVEEAVGRLKGAVFPFEQIKGSAVYAAWRDRRVVETDSLVDLAAGVIYPEMLAPVMHLVAERRFICVPAIANGRCPAIMVFDKLGNTPFSPQQRELLIRYARRVADILENRPTRQGSYISKTGPVACLIIDSNGEVIGSNVDGEILWSSLSGTPWARKVRSRARRILTTGESNHVAIGPDGSNSTGYIAILIPMKLKGQKVVSVTVFDDGAFHDGQLLQAALRENVGAILVDPDLRITSCSADIEELCGYKLGELLGRHVGVLFADPADVKTVLDHQFLFLSSGYFEEIAILKKRDGSHFQARMEALLLADESDRVVGFLVLMREVAQTKSSKDDGPDALMRRERLATLGELAAQLAHEIRNPLVAIGATLESLALEMPEGHEAAATLASLQSEITRMDMVLRDYLSMAARHNASVGMVDLKDVIEDAKALLDASRRGQTRPGSGHVTLTSTISPGLNVLADREGLRHVFFNLMLNAIEAMPNGGEVRCSAKVTRNEVIIRIDDNGPGIAGDPEACFEPFYTTKVHGTGLGLTVCQKIVAAHGGKIFLRNRPRGGCRATVVLPRRGT